MNFGFQRQRAGGGTIAANEVIAFNRQVVNYDTSIIYNDETFTLSAAGDYYVSWFVTLKTGLGINGPTVSLVTNDENLPEYASTNSMKTGQLSGSALIRVTEPTTFQLINRSPSSIVLADNVTISANISIVAINPTTAGADFYLTGSPGVDIEGGGIIPFDTTFSQFNDTITNTNGDINLTNAGRYLVDWSVSLEGSGDATSIKFNLINTIGETLTFGSSESPVVLQGTVYGHALLNIDAATEETPYTINLVNASPTSNEGLATITLGNIGIQATLRIVQI